MTDDLFDTLANPQTEQESPIAPTLQILLSRMWKEANDPKRLRGRPTFDRALYQELKGKGFRLDEVIQEQFGKIAEIEGLREAVEKGLLLDLLEFFTTHEGTADTHTRQEIHDRYIAPARGAARCPARSLPEPLPAGSRGGGRGWHRGLPTDSRHAGAAAPRAVPRLPRPGPACPPRAGGAGGDLERPAHRPGAGSRGPGVRRGGPSLDAPLEKDEPALLEASRRAEERRVAEEAERQRQLREAREREEQDRLQGTARPRCG